MPVSVDESGNATASKAARTSGNAPIPRIARSRSGEAWLAVGLLLAAFALRLYRIADHNIWWDEGFGVYLARLPIRAMVVRTAADVHPPVHYAFLHYWDRLVGETEYAIRLSSVLFGLLDLALLWYVARRYLGRPTAFVAVALLTINRFHIEWSQEIRMYTLAAALALGSTICFLRLVAERDERWRWWLGHLAISVIGLHTVYVVGLVSLGQSAAVALATLLPLGRRRLPVGFLARWTLLQAAALALLVPWALLVAGQPRPPPPQLFTVDLVTWLRAVFTALPIGISAYLDSWVAVTLVATLLALVPLALDRVPARRWVYLAAYPALLIGPAVVYALATPNPFLFYGPNLHVRYLFVLLPLYALVVGRGLVLIAARARWLGAGLGLAAGLVCAWTTLDLAAGRYMKDEYRSIAAFVASYAEPDDAVVLYSDWDWPVAGYYLGDALPRYGVGTIEQLTPSTAAALGERLLGEHRALWLLTLNDAYDADPRGYLRGWLEAQTRLLADFRVDNKRLSLFTSDPARTLAHGVPTRPRQPVASGGELLPRLLGADVFVREIAAGDRLHIATYWQGPSERPTSYGLALVGPDGVVVRRAREPLRRDWPASAWPPEAVVRVDRDVLVSDRLPPGRYRLVLDQVAGEARRALAAPLADLLVRPPAHPPTAPLAPPSPPLPHRADRFGEQIELVGAVIPTARPADGAQIEVTLLWQAIQAMDRPYTAFVQVIGPGTNPATGGPVWGQLDAPPGGDRPTDDLLPGDLALDRRQILLAPGRPAGPVELIVGLYDPDTGQRLRLPDGRDYAVLARWP